MKRILVAIVITAISQEVHAADLSKYMGSYLCTATAGAGIHFDETTSSWMGTPFRFDKVQYILKLRDTQRRIERSYPRLVKDTNGKEEIKGVPHMYPIVTLQVKDRGTADDNYCLDVFLDREDGDKLSTLGEELVMPGTYLSCFVGLTHFQFDFGSGRFQNHASGGYMSPKQETENTDTPFIFVGTCDKIE